jgi:hypothetical protein
LRGVTREISGEVTLRVRDADDSLEVEWAGTRDTRHFELPPPKILMLEMQPEINVRAKLHAARLG